MTKIVRLRAGERVVLVAVPPGLLDGLPDEDQRAITAIVGKPIKLIGYDDIGRAELEFDDPFNDSIHTIWVKPEFIQRDGATQRHNNRSVAIARTVDGDCRSDRDVMPMLSYARSLTAHASSRGETNALTSARADSRAVGQCRAHGPI